MVFPIYSAETSEYLQAEECRSPTSYCIKKLTQKSIKDLNIAKMVTQECVGLNLHEFALGSGFSDITPKAQVAKEKRQIRFHQD